MDILVFDDDLMVMETLVIILKAAGYQISAFHSAEDIMDFALSGPHPSGFQVIVSDYSILNMVDFEPLRILQGINPEVKTIIVSGTCLSPFRLRTIGLRIDGFLAKPFMAHKLVELVDQVAKGVLVKL